MIGHSGCEWYWACENTEIVLEQSVSYGKGRWDGNGVGVCRDRRWSWSIELSVVMVVFQACRAWGVDGIEVYGDRE